MSGLRSRIKTIAPVLVPAWRRFYWSWRRASSEIGWRLDGLTPARLARPKKALDREITIGVATYIARYDRWFRPLFRRIRGLFPEVRTIVAVNGFPDSGRQTAYLDRIRREFANAEQTTFLLHHEPRSLAQLWNEIVDLSTTEKVLVLNDDLELALPFRRWLETAVTSDARFATIQSSWSHFLITRECRRKVGPFDEGFVGVGFEDTDYEGRLALSGVQEQNLDCPWIRHAAEIVEEKSFDAVSRRLWGKYADLNREHFDEKWMETSPEEAVFYARSINRYLAPRKRPVGYDYTCSSPNGSSGAVPLFVEFDEEPGR